MASNRRNIVNQLTRVMREVELEKTTKRKKRARRQRRASAGVNVGYGTPLTAPVAGAALIRRMRGPTFRDNGKNGTIVCNSEVVGTVALAAAGAFQFASLNLIPTNCPWLGGNTATGPAGSFSKWRWLRLRVVYVPTVNTTSSGRFAIGVSYDNGDTAATTVTQVQSMYDSTSAPVWAGWEGASLLHDLNKPISSVSGAVSLDIDVTRFDKLWYPFIQVGVFNGLNTTDKNSYSPCQLFIASSGGVVGAVGDIHLSYEVELIEPMPPAINT